jgi:hypothetical protein
MGIIAAMAAILPHLAVEEDVTDLERAYDVCVTSLKGPRLGADSPACPSPNAVIAEAHAELLKMTFVRQVIEEGFHGRNFEVRAGNRQGKEMKSVFIVLTKNPNAPEGSPEREGTVGPGPAWNPASSPDAGQFNLLSWTSKMNCPSWSIPAGVEEIGGTCPGAVGGQSVVDDGRLKAGQERVRKITGMTLGSKQILAGAVCEHCYATGGQYSTGHVQFAQVLRHIWVRQALETPAVAPNGSRSTAFIETMVYAVDNANYRLDGGTIKADKETGEPEQKLPPEPTGRRFFRIHDSGDFFSAEYLRQWKEVANRLPDITFWAPARIWNTSWGVDAVNQINTPQKNFLIRPSGFVANEPEPGLAQLGPGWIGQTTVIALPQNIGMSDERELRIAERERNTTPRMGDKGPLGRDPRYTWDCRAYAATNDKGKPDPSHTCRKAVAPPGLGDAHGKGCRACWIAPDEIINYTMH